jgi:ELWxxDGT repeat protein
MWLPLPSKWSVRKRKVQERARRLLMIPPRLEALEDRILPSSTPQLLGHINTEAPFFNSFVEVNGVAFFDAKDGIHGEQLWRSDGTAAGSQMVTVGSGSFYAEYLTNVGGTLFFIAYDGTHGNALWRSNGTAAGTQMIKDVYPKSGWQLWPYELTSVGGTLFFAADDGVHGVELWRSDGTAAGTQMVKDINPGGSNSFPNELTNVGGTLFFTPDDGINGDGLWRSDGSATGTKMVKDFPPGEFSETLVDLTNVSGTLFFVADDGIHGSELWRSDGSAAGTEIVKDINPGSSGSLALPQYLTNVSGTLFFTADDGTHRSEELWRSDGSAAETQLIMNFTGAGQFVPFRGSTNVNGRLFFFAHNGSHAALWRSDGSAAGTQMVKDIEPSVLPYATNVRGTLFFAAVDGTHGSELWRSDGSAAGTQMVQTSGGSGLEYACDMTNIRGTLFFSAGDGNRVPAPWVLPVAQATSTSLSVTRGGSNFFGNAITLTADLSTTGPGSLAGTTGTVDFKNGTTTLASGVPLTSLTATDGTATLVIPSGNKLAAGVHHFEAVYSGDKDFATSAATQSATIARAVAQTTISLSNGKANLVYGQNWAVTATVKALSGFGSGSPASGNMLFTDTIVTNASSAGTFLLGGKTTITLGSAPVGAGGVAIFHAGVASGQVLPGVITGFLANGTHANISPVTHVIKAQYSGNFDFTAGGSSAGLGEIVSRDTTQTVIKAVTPNPAQFAQVVTITAIIRSVGGSVAPLGSVTFLDSYTQGGITTNTTLGTVTLASTSAGVGQAMATFTTASLAQAAHSLRVTYNGDTTAPFPPPASFPYRGQWLPSTSAVYGLPVRGDTTTATLSANPPGGQRADSTITFLDSLTATAGGFVNGGVVTFKDGSKVLGASGVDIRGKATLLTSIAGPLGTHSITAYYAGNMNFNASTSNTLAYTITAHSATTNFAVASLMGVNPVVTIAPSAFRPRGSVVFVSESNRPDTGAVSAGSGVEFWFTTNGRRRPLPGALVRARPREDWLGSVLDRARPDV